MKIFECEKCKSKEVFISESGNNIGLYCADCGKWIKWLNKDELRLAERQINSHENELRNKAIDEFAEKLNKKITEFILEHKNNLDFASGISVAWNMVDEIAEQMKGE